MAARRRSLRALYARETHSAAPEPVPLRVTQYDYLIVGAGLSGAVMAERLASQLDARVLVVDRRDHVGGNTHDALDEHGVRVHWHGPHLFHTNARKVWDYLSEFTEWLPYEHRVLGVVDGLQVPLPFNLTSLHALFPEREAERLERLLKAEFGDGANVPILELRRRAAAPDSALGQADGDRLRHLADFVYDRVFHGYSTKQWGRAPEDLGPGVTGRVPVRVSRDDRYFQDRYQAMPAEGYTAMVERILAHPNISVETGVSFAEAADGVAFSRLVYTGPIDAYFDYAHGPLPYRSLRFEREHFRDGPYQAAAVVNYPALEPGYTRITEFKHATQQEVEGTSIAREYPEAYEPGGNEPYYPIPAADNHARHARYAAEADRARSVTFLGRLADYRYYNMDQAVARSLAVFAKRVAPAHRRRLKAAALAGQP